MQSKISRQLEPVLSVFLLTCLQAYRSTQVQRETDNEDLPVCQHDCLAALGVDSEGEPCFLTLLIEEDHMRAVICLSDDGDKFVIEGRGSKDDL